ncbi:MAG: hypothetical protein GY746_05805 [Gammaproteobacteria bacterium]|nr:hypothetical protein [Gammaproteobacteria bacterium]
MKKLIIVLGILLIAGTLLAQAPQSFKYQAIARDVEGNIISNKQVSLRISLLQGSNSGKIVYSETHDVTTNSFGLITLEIGNGKFNNGDFKSINWGLSEYFVNIEIDINGGSNYLTMGTSQLLSVPYALYAERSGSNSKGNSDWYTVGFNTFLAGESVKCGIGTTSPAGILDIAGEYHFPGIDGSNGQVLRTDGSGTLSWANGGAGVMEINDLVDGKTAGKSVFLGMNAGALDDGTDKWNVGLGMNALKANTSGYRNTANGYAALYKNTTGNNNTANGALSLYNNTTGKNNSSSGVWTLYNNTTGNNNTAIGMRALFKNTTGNNNTAFGYSTMNSNTTGINNTANGYMALYYNTTGNNNTAFGYAALFKNTTGYLNTAIGYHALFSNTTGIRNTANGNRALFSNTTGSNNTAIGYTTMSKNTTGYYNTANGYSALSNNTTGHNNTAYGNATLLYNTTGHNNTAYGSNANYYNQSGSNNTMIGYQSGMGDSLHNKSGNVFLGYKAGYSEDGSNKLYIENSNSSTPLIYGEFDNDILAVNGKLGIGTNAPGEELHVVGSIRMVDGNQGAGQVMVSDTNGTARWTAPSNNEDGDWIVSGSDMYSSVIGNVGIGPNTPSEKLDVTGNIKASGTIQSGSSIVIDGTSTTHGTITESHGKISFDDDTIVTTGSIGTGTNTPESSAQLEVRSTTKGLLPPRMTSAQRDLIINPAEGLQIYNTDSKCLNFYIGYSWHELCGTCTPIPIQANAGNKQAIIDETVSATLDANTPVHGTGFWTVESGVGGSFDNSGGPGTIFYGNPCTDYTLAWTISTSCGSTTDSVDISFFATPIQANAGNKQAFIDETVSATLDANTPVHGTGLWTVESGVGGSFDNSGAPGTIFYGNPCTDYTLAWSISTSCGSTTDSVDISFLAIPTDAHAGTDTIVPGGPTSLNLYANTPVIGEGEWTILSGGGGSFENASDPTSLFTGGFNIPYSLQWTISTACFTSMDEMIVTFTGYQIGDDLQGGKVAYILQPGDPGYVEGIESGIIAAFHNHNGYVQWGCYGTSIPGAHGSKALGAGYQNTLDIVVGCGSHGIAARICNDLVIGEYDDWYLPSKDEMSILHANRYLIGGFTGDWLWSSSEWGPHSAFGQGFSPGADSVGEKNSDYNFRPVRSFIISPDSCGHPFIDTRDGNQYETVQVGTQCWMKENLRATTYINGDPIPNVTDGSSWGNLTTGAYVWYENDISWKDKYGALYNWYATIDPKGLCPTGWHMPTNNEWTTLTYFIGGTASPHGNELKSCRQVNSPLEGTCSTPDHPRWDEFSENGTDNYDFSGLPGGFRYEDGSSFYGIGFFGDWWSSTEASSTHARRRGLNYLSDSVLVKSLTKEHGFSVRCIRDLPQCGEPIIDDRDGQEYATVQIGTQCWMKKNLAYLPEVSPSSQGSVTEPYYYVYDYQGTNITEAKAIGNYQTYGVLYNWPASLTACPQGWSLPSDHEWTVLADYLGGFDVAGGKMKEAGTTHWDYPNTGATNSSGFSGLPGGGRGAGGEFDYSGSDGYWWSLSEGLSGEALGRSLSHNDGWLSPTDHVKQIGSSVRCFKNYPF